jgi:hypothetical protein
MNDLCAIFQGDPMSFYMLKSAAIQCLDDISPAEIWLNYGGLYSDTTKLDVLDLTKAKRRTKARHVNDFFDKRYKNQWINVSSDEMGNCATIGAFILLMAQHASVPPSPAPLHAALTAGEFL